MKSFSLQMTFLAAFWCFLRNAFVCSVLSVFVSYAYSFARSSGVKSKVLATSCNTHNIGLQYMIGCLMNFQCFAIFSPYKSTFPMLILLSKLIPRIVETLEVWPSTAAISSSQGLGGWNSSQLIDDSNPNRRDDQVTSEAAVMTEDPIHSDPPPPMPECCECFLGTLR